MFEMSETALHVITYVGAATCFFAATVAWRGGTPDIVLLEDAF